MDVQKYDIVRRDGTYEERWWKPANAPVVDVNGNVVAIIHHVADVTAEYRAAEGLRESEERLRKVINAETVGIVFFDLVGGISDSNDAFLRMIGHSREELEAGEVRYEQLTPPEWRWRDEETIADLRSTGRAGPYEKEYFRRDGSRMWILCSSQLLDPDKAVEFVVDVTEAKRAEDKLRESGQRRTCCSPSFSIGSATSSPSSARSSAARMTGIGRPKTMSSTCRAGSPPWPERRPCSPEAPAPESTSRT